MALEAQGRAVATLQGWKIEANSAHSEKPSGIYAPMACQPSPPFAAVKPLGVPTARAAPLAALVLLEADVVPEPTQKAPSDRTARPNFGKGAFRAALGWT